MSSQDRVDATPAYLLRLQKTLEAELYAHDYYAAASTALPGVRRYSRLTRAELNHADAVGWAIVFLGGKPVFDHDEEVTPPGSVAEADEHCTQIELHVIDVYEGLIRDCPSAQVLPVLQNIQEANYRHLSAVSG